MKILFRDGEREVVDYIGEVLRPYQDRLYQLTFEEGLEFANRVMLTDFVNSHQAEVINEHFQKQARGE